MSKSPADKFRHRQPQVDIYGKEAELMNNTKKLKFKFDKVRSETIICRRVRLTTPSKLTTLSGEGIYREPVVFEALLIGDGCAQYSDIKKGDMFIASESEATLLHEDCQLTIGDKECLVFEIVKAYHIIATGNYELNS